MMTCSGTFRVLFQDTLWASIRRVKESTSGRGIIADTLGLWRAFIVCHVFLWMPLAFAATAHFAIVPPNQTATSPSRTTGKLSTATASSTPTETTTYFYSFNRYSENYPYWPEPWNGSTLDGVGLRKDQGFIMWFNVSGVWDYDIEETWEETYLQADGTMFDGVRRHAAMGAINGTIQKCISAYSLPDGKFLDKTCADDPNYGKSVTNSIAFGASHTPWSDTITLYGGRMTHNGSEFWTTQYLVSDIGVIDPNSPAIYNAKLIQSNGALSTNVDDITQQASWTWPNAAVTDGLTPLFIKAGSVSTIPVTFQIQSLSTADGTLTDLYGYGGSTSVEPALQKTTSGEAYALGVYQVPGEIGTTAFSREIQLQMSFALPWRSSPTILFANLTLTRPPVILIHGIWSDPSVWASVEASLAGRFLTRTVNWRPGETALWSNVRFVYSLTQDLIQNLRWNRVAVTQLDVVGHSAGGLLARLWAQVGGDGGYRRVNNFRYGDFRKLITIGTPHRGSEVATLVQQLLATNTSWTNIIQFYFNRHHTSLTRGVIADLAPSSSILQGLLPTPAKALPWVGTTVAIPDTAPEYRMWHVLADLCSARISQTITACQGVHGPTDAELLRARVFLNDVNDGLVRQASQTDGLVPPGQCVLPGVVHTAETYTPGFIQNLAAFLDSDSGFAARWP